MKYLIAVIVVIILILFWFAFKRESMVSRPEAESILNALQQAKTQGLGYRGFLQLAGYDIPFDTYIALRIKNLNDSLTPTDIMSAL